MIRPPQRSPLFPSTTLSRSLSGSLDPAVPPPSSPPPATTPAKPAQTKAADLIDLHFDLDDAPPKAARTPPPLPGPAPDRKSTRLNSSHGYISYAVFCLKKKT